MLGVVLSAFLGVGLGTLCGLWRTGEWLLIPVFIVLQAAPVAAFIPLVTFIYGIGMTAKTLAVMILALPVIVLNTYKAVRNVNASLIADVPLLPRHAAGRRSSRSSCPMRARSSSPGCASASPPASSASCSPNC